MTRWICFVFAGVAIVVSGLVAKARRERARAEEAAERERRARDERDRLIATVSHDMATPLAVLSGTLQFMRHAGARTESELARLLVRLETATGRATSLVRTLADAQALDADGFTLTVRAVDLREILAPIAQMLDRVSDRHPVVLAMPDTPVIVQADAERLQRVVENVVSNAIKYSPDGGGVEMCLTVEMQQAVIRVRDYGIGISSEALPHVFDRSYRARGSRRSSAGTGARAEYRRPDCRQAWRGDRGSAGGRLGYRVCHPDTCVWRDRRPEGNRPDAARPPTSECSARRLLPILATPPATSGSDPNDVTSARDNREIPTSACASAGASFTPSPVMATNTPRD